jgi:hypothetical protein
MNDRCGRYLDVEKIEVVEFKEVREAIREDEIVCLYDHASCTFLRADNWKHGCWARRDMRQSGKIDHDLRKSVG